VVVGGLVVEAPKVRKVRATAKGAAAAAAAAAAATALFCRHTQTSTGFCSQQHPLIAAHRHCPRRRHDGGATTTSDHQASQAPSISNRSRDSKDCDTPRPWGPARARAVQVAETPLLDAGAPLPSTAMSRFSTAGFADFFPSASFAAKERAAERKRVKPKSVSAFDAAAPSPGSHQFDEKDGGRAAAAASGFMPITGPDELVQTRSARNSSRASAASQSAENTAPRGWTDPDGAHAASDGSAPAQKPSRSRDWIRVSPNAPIATPLTSADSPHSFDAPRQPKANHTTDDASAAEQMGPSPASTATAASHPPDPHPPAKRIPCRDISQAVLGERVLRPRSNQRTTVQFVRTASSTLHLHAWFLWSIRWGEVSRKKDG
jgi:hypothetical protein